MLYISTNAVGSRKQIAPISMMGIYNVCTHDVHYISYPEAADVEQYVDCNGILNHNDGECKLHIND